MRVVIQEDPTDQQVDLGMMATLICEAFGIPDPGYTWYRITDNSMMATAVELNSRVRSVNGTLTFNPTVRDDAGMYRCFAENKHGEAPSQLASLTIIGMHVASLLDIS